MHKAILTLLTAALGLTAVAAAQTAPPANAYFLDSIGSGAHAVWVDGQKVIPAEFVGTPASMPFSIEPGWHHIVTTPVSAKLGERDISAADVNVPGSGTYTFNLKQKVPANSADGFNVPTTVVDAGTPR